MKLTYSFLLLLSFTCSAQTFITRTANKKDTLQWTFNRKESIISVELYKKDHIGTNSDYIIQPIDTAQAGDCCKMYTFITYPSCYILLYNASVNKYTSIYYYADKRNAQSGKLPQEYPIIRQLKE